MALNIHQFKSFKKEGKKITMLTCYDAGNARLLNKSEVDLVLVGDSVAMVLHGFESTVHATMEMMESHTAAVRRGAPDKIIVGDLPFLSFRKDKYQAAENAARLIRAGANCVKLEGLDGHEDVIHYLVESGIPVMGHLGLTPQSVHQLGGHKVQGRRPEAAQKILKDAKKLEELGCFSVVLECVPSEVTRDTSKALEIPTIGIGAGPNADGQVLVLPDMLGSNLDFTPKFLRRYGSYETSTLEAVKNFVSDVQEGHFPSEKESYTSGN